jgi:Lipocalin-like domain
MTDRLLLAELVGAWRLVSFQFERIDTGERLDAFGRDPQGRAMVSADGHVMALLTASRRSAATDQASKAALFDSMIAYSGACRVEGDDRFVTSCDLAWTPGWVDSEQVRICKIEDGKLSLRSGPLTHPAVPDCEVYSLLEWQREV